jgi:hypothetical protein
MSHGQYKFDVTDLISYFSHLSFIEFMVNAHSDKHMFLNCFFLIQHISVFIFILSFYHYTRTHLLYSNNRIDNTESLKKAQHGKIVNVAGSV